jgi:hypothetical protein
MSNGSSLHQHAEGPCAAQDDLQGGIQERRLHNYCRRVSSPADLPQEGQTIQARHLKIGDDDVKVPLLEMLEGLDAILGPLGLVSAGS